MKNGPAVFILEIVFIAVYFTLLSNGVKWLFRLAPVNFVFDLLAVACIVAVFVVSIGLAEFTVKKLREYL